MADKSRFGPELAEAEIDALVDNTTPGNTKELLILEFLIKQLFYSGLLDYLSLHIQRALVEY